MSTGILSSLLEVAWPGPGQVLGTQEKCSQHLLPEQACWPPGETGVLPGLRWQVAMSDPGLSSLEEGSQDESWGDLGNP